MLQYYETKIYFISIFILKPIARWHQYNASVTFLGKCQRVAATTKNKPIYPISQKLSVKLYICSPQYYSANLAILMYCSSYARKYEVNCDWGENKPRQMLYKELSHSPEVTLEERQFEVIERPTLRLYCSECELDLTRSVLIITRTDYYCVRCFANLEEFPPEYLVRKALRQSFTGTSWDIMDEVMLTTAFKLWGFGNWGQIKEYLDYNCSPFPLKEIEQHFQRYYLHQPDYLPPFEHLVDTATRHTFAEMNQQSYSNSLRIQEGDLKRRDSKGEKKPLSSLRSLSLISSSRDIDPDNPNPNPNPDGSEEMLAHMDQEQTRRQKQKQKEKDKEKRNECSILGYNMKRKEFELGQYDYTAENMLAELQFYDGDGEEQFKLKLQIIEAYNQRLQQRLRRRSFVVEYRLLDSEYHYHQQCKLDKETIHFFQSFMRFTPSHQQYRSLVDAYSLDKRYERFITNLSRIRERASREGALEEAYGFMKRKREKYIQRWEKTYNKIYHDKKRTVLTVGQRDGKERLLNENGEEGGVGSVDFGEMLDKAMEHENEIIRMKEVKAKTLFVPSSSSSSTVSF